MKSAVAAALLLAFCSPALSAATLAIPTPYPANLQPSRSTDAERAQAKRQRELHDKLLAIREEGLKLRDADGGTLTEEHRAYLQAKLEALNTEAAVAIAP